MTSIDVPRNSTQAAGNIQTFSARITNSVTGQVYTCPVGKRARITQIEMFVDALGSDATVHIASRVDANFTELSLGVPISTTAFVTSLTINELVSITCVGDDGATNQTVDMICTVEEFNV